MTKKFIGQIQTLADIEADAGLDKGMKNTPVSYATQQVRQALKGLTRDDFGKVLKDERLTIRMSTKDREKMETTAATLGLSVGDYLVQLHQIAVEKLGPADPH